MSLHLKFRPNNLSEVFGNKEVVTTLKGMLKRKDKMPHSFLFHGPTGCGKTTFARIIATELNCSESNIIEIDTAQFRGIDTVREIRKTSQYIPLGGGVRIYIIDEVHKMTGDAQNAFLKILEDTPKDVFFILCTTDPQSLLPTIKGRCSQFQVQQLKDEEMDGLLTKVLEVEEDEIEKEVMEQIILDSQGHPRNALQILEQVLNTPKKKRLMVAQQAAIEQTESIALCRALMNRTGGWNKVRPILQGLKGQDAESIRRVIIGYASSVLLNGDNQMAGTILEIFDEPLFNSGFPGLVLRCYSIIKG